MSPFRKALLKIIVLSASAAVSLMLAPWLCPESALGAVFPDISADSLFYPHIQRLFEEHFVSGDTRSGTFRPHDTINRAEFAKITAYTRLAEEYGVADNWSSKDALGMAFEIFALLKPYFGCGQDACENIGGVPFIDVPESDPNCDDNPADPNSCEPWFSRYIYYAVSKGYIKGYSNADGTRSFRPEENILRIHALKMLMADNGNILPEYDSRYQSLTDQTESLNSYSPKCIKGSENYIKDLNGGNTADAEKLLKYALLADKLDLFGNKCEVFGSYSTPLERAQFLQKPLTREETPRYFAITTAYIPIRPDASDTTINTAEQNLNSLASVRSYSLPTYERTSLYDRQGGDESIWGDTVQTAEKNEGLDSALKTTSAQPAQRPVYNSDTAYLDSPTALLNRLLREKTAQNVNLSAVPKNTSANTSGAQPKPGGFASTANISTCANKTTKACRTTLLGDCITVGANTSFKTVSTPEFGTSIPTYYSSLWQKVSLSGGYYYIPLDDVALDSDVYKCGSFGGKSYLVADSTKTVASLQGLPAVSDYTTTKTTTPSYTGVVKTQLVASAVGEKPWYSVAWDAVGNAKDTAVNWVTAPKRVEGFKQVSFGLLETVGGLASGATGIALLTAGGVTEVGSAGASTPLSIPLVLGGSVALGYAANGITGGTTGIVSGFKNIFGSSDKIINDRFSPGETLIKATTKEGSAERTVATTIYIGGDILSASGKSIPKFATKLSEVKKAEGILEATKVAAKAVADVPVNIIKSAVSTVSDVGALAKDIYKSGAAKLDTFITGITGGIKISAKSFNAVKDVAKLTGAIDKATDLTALAKALEGMKDADMMAKAVIETKNISKITDILTSITDSEKRAKIISKMEPVQAEKILAGFGRNSIETLAGKTKNTNLLQPVNDYDQLYKIAEVKKIQFDTKMRVIAVKVGAKAELTDLKSYSAAIRKAGGASETKDMVRGTLVFDDLNGLEANFDKIADEYDIVKLKDRIKNPEKTGYRDINMVVKDSDGFLYEVRLSTKKLFSASNTEHYIYEIRREFTDSINPPSLDVIKKAAENLKNYAPDIYETVKSDIESIIKHVETGAMGLPQSSLNKLQGIAIRIYKDAWEAEKAGIK